LGNDIAGNGVLNHLETLAGDIAILDMLDVVVTRVDIDDSFILLFGIEDNRTY
jgi:hypothetical protein